MDPSIEHCYALCVQLCRLRSDYTALHSEFMICNTSLDSSQHYLNANRWENPPISMKSSS